MDVMGYRNSGELSDITVIVDGEEFHLHKFPLFVRSEYFRNLSAAASEDTPARVILENFPGGPKVFAVVADYCYNKEVNIDEANVIEVICAAEYLRMTGGIGRGGLSMVADNILFDLTYLNRNKRDYKLTLGFIKKAAGFAEIIQNSGVYKKLIDALVESILSHVKASGVYESINIYSKSKNGGNEKKMHNLALEDDTIDALNSLPLKWINDIVRCGIRLGLNQALIAYIVQNYIDFNTGLNPSYNYEVAESLKKTESQETEKKNDQENNQDNQLNLVKMCGDILKFANAAGVDENTEKKDEKSSLNLIQMASDILTTATDFVKKIEPDENSYANESDRNSEVDGAVNLKTIMGAILIADDAKKSDEDDCDDEESTANAGEVLVDAAVEEAEKEGEEEKTVGEVLEELKDDEEKEEEEVSVSGEVSEPEIADCIQLDVSELPEVEVLVEANDQADKPSSNLNSIVGDILTEAASNNDESSQDGSNLKSILGDILTNTVKETDGDKEANQDDKPQPSNLIKIAGDIFNITEKLSKNTVKKRKDLSDNEKLEIIKNLTNIFIDLRMEPQFQLAWLLSYTETLGGLNAEKYLKSAFSRWSWSSLMDMRSKSSELVEISPSAIIQLATEMMNDTDWFKNDTGKLIEIIDRYINELNAKDKLDAETFAKLIGCVPDEKRTNFNDLTNILLDVMEKEKDLDTKQKNDLFALINLQKVDEKTLEKCKDSDYIPQNVVTEAALSLCSKLRKELDEAKLLNKSYEYKTRPLVKSSEHVPSYTSAYTTKYRSPSRNKTVTIGAADLISEPRSTISSTYTTSPILTTPLVTSTTSSRVTNITTPSSYQRSTTPTPVRDTYRSLSSSRTYTPSSSRTKTRSPTVIDTTFKSRNYNPPTTYTPVHSHSTYRHSGSCLDYDDEGLYDSYVPTTHYDDSEYYCATHHHYQYYPRIY